MKIPTRYFLETKLLSLCTLAVIVLVVLSIWLSGLSYHRSLFKNFVISTSILGGAFFLFISLGLYYGLKLKDNLGKILNKERIKNTADKMPLFDSFEFDPADAGDGIGGIIISIILWFIIAILFTFLFYFFGVFFWIMILLFAAMLYWIFFRALRLVFKNSRHCKGNLLKSFGFGFFYSILYMSWISGIIFLVNYLN
jgi:hypothetical protein